MKRIVLLALAAGAIAASIPVVRPAAERAWFIYTLATEGVPAHLPNPVDAASAGRLANSWGAARQGGRRHEGIDIFAPKGTPVVSTTRGIVTRVGVNRLGGQVVGVLGPGLEWHYYAHLDRFGTFGEGDVVRAGDVLGYVGNTGNARGTPSHLHYGIYRDGAKNPHPRLTAPARIARSAQPFTGRSGSSGRTKVLPDLPDLPVNQSHAALTRFHKSAPGPGREPVLPAGHELGPDRVVR